MNRPTRRLHSKSLLLPVSTAALLLLGACQSTGLNTKSDEIKGTPLVVADKPDRCAHPYKAQNTKITSLSPKAKRRLTYDYVHAIRSKIVSHWNKPRSTNGSACKVRISQRPDGCVKSIHFVQCTDTAMQKTVSKAVRTASPLPRAPHPLIFDDKVTLSFEPPRTSVASTQQPRPQHGASANGKKETGKSRQAKRR